MSKRTDDPASTHSESARSKTTADRSQSTVIGIVLLTAVIVILVSVSGLFIISNFATATPPNLNLEAEATTQNVTIQHGGGDNMETSDLDVILRGDTERRYALDGFTQLQGDDESRFQSGDRWYRTHGIDSDRMEILIVHTASNTILDKETVTVVETLAARSEYSPTNPTTVDTVDFDGSDSIVRDGTIDSYDWRFGDGTTGSGETVDHSYDDAGEYDVNLTVTTADGRTATQIKTVEILPPVPTASFEYDPTNPEKGEQITFNGSDSEAPDGDIVEYRWEFGDGTTITGNDDTVTHSYDEFGEYQVKLTVESDNGETDSTTKTVQITAGFRADVKVSNLVEDQKNTDQIFTIDLLSDLDGTETIDIDVSDSGTDVEYFKNDNKYTVTSNNGAVTNVITSGNGRNEVVERIQFEPDSTLADGTQIRIRAENIDTARDAGNQLFDVDFRAAGNTENTSYFVRVDGKYSCGDSYDGGGIYATGDVCVESGLQVDGDVDAGGMVTLEEDAGVTGSVTAGDKVTSSSGVSTGSIEAGGEVSLGEDNLVDDITADGQVSLGEDTSSGAISSDRKVSLASGASADTIDSGGEVSLNSGNTVDAITADGQVSLGEDSSSGDISSNRKVTLSEGADGGSIDAGGEVSLNSDNTVDDITADGQVSLGDSSSSGDITAGRKVTLSEDATTGSITAEGDVTTGDGSLVDGNVDVTDGDGQAVSLKEGTTVSGDVFVEDGDDISCSDDVSINGTDCETYVQQNY